MLRDVWRAGWRRMLTTYAVLLAESVVFAFFPYYLGKAVDGVFGGDRSWFFLYLIICMAGCVVGAARRCYDTRVFGGIWRRLSGDVVVRMMDNGADPSKVITRAGLSTRFIDFYEFAVPTIVRASVSVIVAIIMLWAVVGIGTLWVLVLFGMTSSVSLWVSYRKQKWDHYSTDARDALNDAIGKGMTARVDDAYGEQVNAYVRSSDWDSVDWVQGTVFAVIGEVIVILTLAEGQSVTPGEVLVAIGYVWQMFSKASFVSRFFDWMRSVEVANQKIAEEIE